MTSLFLSNKICAWSLVGRQLPILVIFLVKTLLLLPTSNFLLVTVYGSYGRWKNGVVSGAPPPYTTLVCGFLPFFSCSSSFAFMLCYRVYFFHVFYFFFLMFSFCFTFSFFPFFFVFYSFFLLLFFFLFSVFLFFKFSSFLFFFFPFFALFFLFFFYILFFFSFFFLNTFILVCFFVLFFREGFRHN